MTATSESHENVRFQKDLRKGLETTAREAYLAQIRTLDEKLEQRHAEVKARLQQQTAESRAEAEGHRQRAATASGVTTELGKELCRAEGEAAQVACRIKAAVARQKVLDRAQFEQEKRVAKEELTEQLRRSRREGEPPRAADEARDAYAAKLTKLENEHEKLADSYRTSLPEQLADIRRDYDAIKAKLEQASQEEQRLAQEARKAAATAAKKQAALVATFQREVKREEALVKAEKKAVERAFKAEMRQIEASTRESARKRTRAPQPPKPAIQSKAPHATASSAKGPRTLHLRKGHYAEIVPGKSIRLFGTVREGERSFSRTFELGDPAEYDSYNVSYVGKIKAIAPNTVSIVSDEGTSHEKTHRLNLENFERRNWDFSEARARQRNRDWYEMG